LDDLGFADLVVELDQPTPFTMPTSDSMGEANQPPARWRYVIDALAVDGHTCLTDTGRKAQERHEASGVRLQPL
jgi:hypothetical protein